MATVRRCRRSKEHPMIDLAASTSGWSTASDRTAREQECGEPPSVCGGPQPWRNLAPIVCPRSFSSQEMPTLLTMLPFPTAFGPEAADFRSAIEPSAVRGAADAPLEGPAHPLMGQDRCLSFMIRYGTTSKPSRQEACSWRTPSCMSASWTQQQYNLLSRLVCHSVLAGLLATILKISGFTASLAVW